ncbi:endoplasmic reticulum junction formation protein lunapark [Biomphalaria pfeifferi]|uniref:Endoplasmic reticulum junction formation protein lunapark n=1 Tax=Biomphalaria pfeifferi TaxID=112525 RepID=A0AAD8C7R8_BIOPF|nr:endoplasmic reticulum junction formation protein lunapark [Biomphalaria pfeifferi]
MGLLISRFKHPQTTIEVLEQIDKDISRLQRNRKANQDKQKKLVATFLIYSVIVYILAAVIFFLLYFPEQWAARFIYSLPLLLFPFLIWGLKKLLHWYFVKRIHSNDLALQSLRERKKQILEDVMETETYKKAREILEKFDPSRLRQLEGTVESPARGGAGPSSMGMGTGLHQRNVQTSPSQLQGNFNPRMAASTPQRQRFPPGTPIPMQRPLLRPQNNVIMRPSAPPGPGYAVPPGPPMPRTILSRDRGVMDRMMDYLVGDGPENRYALICQYCHSHNGMALREEFEYLSFRCCYCFSLNPARKQRPIAPRLEFFAPPGVNQMSGRLSGSEESISNKVVKDEPESSEEEVEDDSDNDSPKIDNSVLSGDTESVAADNGIGNKDKQMQPQAEEEPAEKKTEEIEPAAEEPASENSVGERIQEIQEALTQ